MRTRITAIDDLHLLDDGRVGVLVTFEDPVGSLFGYPVERSYLVLTKRGDRWLIDESYSSY